MEWIKFTRGFYDALPREQRVTRQHLFQARFDPREPWDSLRAPQAMQNAGKNSPTCLNPALIHR